MLNIRLLERLRYELPLNEYELPGSVTTGVPGVATGVGAGVVGVPFVGVATGFGFVVTPGSGGVVVVVGAGAVLGPPS
jgi:hypothetical protein